MNVSLLIPESEIIRYQQIVAVLKRNDVVKLTEGHL